ncbi:MAG TPA: hypothetical protein VMD02_03220 [Candidatus Omnitrophota bacterium]|nr:hypothetical protein [Candidatus Omnitrophota bacterium]
MKLRSVIIGLLFIAFILTPLYGSVELLSLIPSMAGMINKGMILIFKLTKDVILAGALFFFAFEVIKSKKMLRSPLVWTLLAFIVVAAYITFHFNGFMMAAIGIRVFLPLMLVFIGAKYFDDRLFDALTIIMTWIALIEYAAAVIQMFFALPIMGSGYFGLAARPFGTFVQPSSFAIFICMVMVMNMARDINARGSIRSLSWVFLTVSTMFVVLSGSGTGLLGLAIIFLVYLFIFSRTPKLVKAGIVPTIALLPVLILLSLPVLTNREDIYYSLWMRIEIINELVVSSGWSGFLIGTGIGTGSNAAVTILGNPNLKNVNDAQQFIADSLYASVFAQVGAVFLLLFIILSLYVFWLAIKRRQKRLVDNMAILFVPLMLMVSFGSIILEVFPFNWIMFLLFGAVLMKKENNEVPLRNT